MSEAACKAAICVGGCLDAIVVDNARETAEATRELAANGALSDAQLADLIKLYTDFEKEVDRRAEADRRLRDATKKIVIG
jgi:hypothetical protein